MQGFSDDELEIRIIEKKTGKQLKVIGFESNVSKDKWEKVVAKQLATVLEICGNVNTKFIAYLLSVKDDRNRFFGSYKTMANESGASIDAIKRLMPRLKKLNFVSQVDTGIYMINPKVVRPGERWKGSVLVQMWDDNEG